MNISMIRVMLGRMIWLESILLIIPLFVGLFMGDPARVYLSYAATALIGFGIGVLLTRRPPKETRFHVKEGFVITSLSWIILSLLGGLPLSLSGDFPSFIDGFFEISSGFTTTGASVATDVEALSYATLFWRSFTHLIGGMGILVFILALLPKIQNDQVHVMKAEVPGPTFSKVVAKLGSSARILYLIYLGMTLVMFLVLVFLGMPVFDALLHAFGTAGTGGFGIKANSVGYYSSPAIHYAIAIGMILFGVNFNLYYLILLRKFKRVFKSEELRWYLSFIAVATIFITIQLSVFFDPAKNNLEETFRHSFFTVASIITTTGFTTANFDAWPLFNHIILLLLMFVGACAGSTGGGLKVSRVAIAIKSAFAEFRRTREPRRITHIKFEGEPVSGNQLRSILSYIAMYICVFTIILLVISLDGNDFATAFSAVASTINNIGPGLSVVGPMSSFAGFSPFSKIILSFAMIIGRLELWPILILFSASTWKKAT